jgi:hypothetical protein
VLELRHNSIVWIILGAKQMTISKAIYLPIKRMNLGYCITRRRYILCIAPQNEYVLVDLCEIFFESFPSDFSIY